jgi:hypothetical protein
MDSEGVVTGTGRFAKQTFPGFISSDEGSWSSGEADALEHKGK